MTHKHNNIIVHNILQKIIKLFFKTNWKQFPTDLLSLDLILKCLYTKYHIKINL